jgi:hypothetical protein
MVFAGLAAIFLLAVLGNIELFESFLAFHRKISFFSFPNLPLDLCVFTVQGHYCKTCDGGEPKSSTYAGSVSSWLGAISVDQHYKLG